MEENKMYYKGKPKYQLTPKTSDWMHELFNNQSVVKGLVERYGSPINVHHLPSFNNNCEMYKQVFESYGLKYRIFYARKANKSRGLVKQAFASGIGVDTASFKELEQSLALGGNSENLVLTAAIKTEPQIELAIKNGVPIILDNEDECVLTQAIANRIGLKANVGFRISGFTVDQEKLYSRFGFDVDEVVNFIASYVGENKSFDMLDVTGLHFHLDGYSTYQRSVSLVASVQIFSKLKEKGYAMSFIDIGGGILMNYLEDEKEWNTFNEHLKKSVLEDSNDITFNNNSLGFRLEDGQLRGKLNTYPFFNEINKESFIGEVLDFVDDQSGLSVASLLVKNGVELRIEPGRSLLDQVGMTIAKVIHRKKDAKGQWLVGLEMNMSQMMSSSADFLLDPFMLYNSEVEKNENVDVFFTGAYCLERDVLLKRKITLPRLPAIGEYVAFVNTAGYMMHFFETEAHLFELSSNLMFTGSNEKLSFFQFIDDAKIALEQ
ncbi:type III PLP-dependent enzyme domain-containing protein [Maribacter dokdonensis]|uniref:diaminopimelate decarboxylase n=1 Tax=Maribacter dokdonensis TaxID=320912 RepID=UPI0007198CCA|nr:diaminopimelate decarboxylase [Maribacter dokdonensis]KSA12307.1 Diaminopimelate decarboxylase [Maribacter dokdonensis DSW-8]